MTNDINNIIQELENNATMAEKLVNDVVDSIYKENIDIDNTMNDFIELEDNIQSLNYNIDYILSSIKQVSDFNIKIENHITNLSSSSEDVLASTEEVVRLNTENSNKTMTTRKMLTNLQSIIEKLDNLQIHNSLEV